MQERKDLRANQVARHPSTVGWRECTGVAGVHGRRSSSAEGRKAVGQDVTRDDCIRWRVQPVNATHWLNISAGVWKADVLRGLSFNCRAIALSCGCEKLEIHALRQVLPDQAGLNALARQLNERPRKTLGFQTSAEMFS